MAVFTTVTWEQASAFLAPLGVGKLLALQGIRDGIENSNYFVTTEGGEFVLTLFERLPRQQLPFYLGLMGHLARKGIPVPEPCRDARGEVLFELHGKPAVLVTKLPGSHVKTPQAAHCAQVGAMLAAMHMAGREAGLAQPNMRGLAWWCETSQRVGPFLDGAQRELMVDELAFQQSLAVSSTYLALPQGPIHADLFRDNVLFASGDQAADANRPSQGGADRLSGFFDFYFAATDTWLFDIAVCLNDWCVDAANGTLNQELATAFLKGYAAARPLQHSERALLPALLRAAALRFWLSRLRDLHFARDSSLLQAHDPTHFEKILRLHRSSGGHCDWIL